jgi:LysM repeat protein
MGLGSVSLPPVLAGLGAVVLAALALFFLPSILGIGNPAASSAPSGSPGPSVVAASPTAAGPTAIPAPTAQIYLVQSGDTMSRIANKFGVPLQALIDANKAAIPNPDSLAIGQQVIIPSVAPTSLPDTPIVTEAPSATP